MSIKPWKMYLLEDCVILDLYLLDNVSIQKVIPHINIVHKTIKQKQQFSSFIVDIIVM